MGLLNAIPGVGGSSSESGGSVTVHRIYLADPAPGERDSLDEYQLMFGPDVETDGEDWAAYRCTTPSNIPPETQLYVFEEGEIVQMNHAFQLCLAQFVTPEDVDRENYDGYYTEFPEELAGRSIPEGSAFDQEELKMFYLSVSDVQ